MHIQLQPSENPPYTTIPRTLTFITWHDQLLMIKGSPNKKHWPHLYNGIGGHILPGEDIHQAALRELHEEANLAHLKAFHLQGIIHITTSQQPPGILLFIFTGNALHKTDPNTTPEGTTEWVRWRLLPTNLLVPDLPTLLPYLEARTPGDVPFTGLYHYDATHKPTITLHPELADER